VHSATLPTHSARCGATCWAGVVCVCVHIQYVCACVHAHRTRAQCDGCRQSRVHHRAAAGVLLLLCALCSRSHCVCTLLTPRPQVPAELARDARVAARLKADRRVHTVITAAGALEVRSACGV
jgi:hypothetical protein